MSTFQSAATLAQQYNLPIIMGETNSEWQGLSQGDISNTFINTLWAFDYLFTLAQSGYRAAALFGSIGGCNYYSPLCEINNTIVPEATYYAMLAFHHAVGSGGTVLPVNFSTHKDITSYAVARSNGQLGVVLINKDPSDVINAQIFPGGKFANQASVDRLAATSLLATSSITFGGSSVNADGTWSAISNETITASNSSYTVALPPASAVVVLFQPPSVAAVPPAAPTIGTATAGSNQAVVTFTAPTSNGGASIIGYTATSNPGGLTGTAASSPIKVFGLTSGDAYTFTVVATNSAGTSPASAPSNLVTLPATLTPTSVSFGPRGTTGTVSVTAGNGHSWTASSNASWLTITSGSSGSGDGTVGYSFTANPGTSTRVGTLTIAGQTFAVTQTAAPPPVAFFALTPCRIADTRSMGGSGLTGAFGPPSMAAGATRSFPVPASNCQVPSTAQAYSLNITVVPPGPMFYLTTWPTGEPIPGVSTLNDLSGGIVANAAIVPAGTDGSIDVFVSNATDVIIDINGYFAPSTTPQALAFYPATPCRIADTRTVGGSGLTGAFGPPEMTAGSTRSFPVAASSCEIPSTAQAYSLNMTVVPPGPMFYMTTWPTGETIPGVSTLDDLSGAILANAAIVPAGTGGAVDVFVYAATNLIIDTNGYFAPPGRAGALNFYPLTPCRVADTRTVGGSGLTGAFGPPEMAAGYTRSFPVLSSSCRVPATAQAYSLNMTVVPPGPMYYLTTWPTGETIPGVSTLNDLSGAILANAAIVPAGTGGAINIFTSDPTDLIIDINGYFAP